MRRTLFTLAAAAALFAGAAQAAPGANSIVFGFGVTHGTADLAGTFGGGYAPAFTSPEIGGRFEYWNLMKEDYALNFMANVGTSSETDKPGTGAPANAPEGKFTTSSWSVRLGGDRVYRPNDRTMIFFGPGIEYWSGSAKFEDIANVVGSYKTKNVSRISLHGHTGAMMFIGPRWGLSGQLGHKVGMASYKEAGAKTTWWPSSLDGAMELVFQFGGK